MSIILDLIVIAIVIWCVFVSAKRGFVTVLVETVGIIAAFSLALTFSTPLANLTYDKIIEPAVVKSIESKVQETTDVTTDKVIEVIPQNILDTASALGLPVDEIITNIPSETVDTSSIAQAVSGDVVKPIVIKISELAFTVLLFCVLSFIVRLLAKALNKLFSFSIVGKMNCILGGVVGGVRGLISATMLCVAISFVITLLGNGIWIFTLENIDKTFIFKHLSGLTDIFNI